MSVARSDFPSFFAALHDGALPFAWQERLLDHVLAEGRWPDRVVAPTGSGKTAVLDVHVFAVALMAAGRGPRIPRRLALIVDRRALVDSQHELAIRLSRSLRQEATTEHGVLAEVGRLLLALRSSRESDLDPLLVALLRGGALPDRRWVDDPTAAGIICATPAMWGSRLLFRGYGASRQARPREAGLLAYDAVVVVDEAHLARQLVATARRLEALESMALRRPEVPLLQVVEATATPGTKDFGAEVGVSVADLEVAGPAAANLVARLSAPKPVALIAWPDWPATSSASRQALARRMADEAVALRAVYGPTIACIANTVPVALAAAGELRRRGMAVEILVGRMRPHDISRLRERRPGLLSPAGDPDVDVVIATQTIEVGVDADFSAMVTELAPGSALAQRAGRVNRLGRRAIGEVRVIVPAGEVPAKGAPPYEAGDLSAARTWLTDLADTAAGLAPWSVVTVPPPSAALPRVVLARPEPWDAALLGRTSDALFAEPDLALWLEDELDADDDVAVVVRAGLPHEPADALPLLRATPPRTIEAFPVAMRMLIGMLARDAEIVYYRWRGDEVEPGDEGDRLRPGDVVIVSDETAWFTAGVVDPEGTERAVDVLEAVIDDEPFMLRIGALTPLDAASAGRAAELVAALMTLTDDYRTDSRARRAAMADTLDTFARSLGDAATAHRERLHRAAALLRGRLRDAEVTIGPAIADTGPSWIVIADVRHHLGDEEARQTWSMRIGSVPLAEHQAAVAARAAGIAQVIGIGPGFVDALRQAGELHDEGKRDLRFQRLLRGDTRAQGEISDDVPLAKSGMRTPSEFRAAAAAAGLPRGWRHEQLSAVIAADRLAAAGRDSDLTVRLVGTSHGHGRVGFPHTTAGLLESITDDNAISAGLHDRGAWDAIVDRTHRAYGTWGCAFLEAILRAADCQVSREGG
jgi:CRISPR-associated endonuclease/helicase Cas3